jgi:hypothetical protein
MRLRVRLNHDLNIRRRPSRANRHNFVECAGLKSTLDERTTRRNKALKNTQRRRAGWVDRVIEAASDAWRIGKIVEDGK